MKKYITKQSSIKGAGKGLFTNAFFKKGEVIGLAHVNDQPASEIGRNHNHNEKNPTAYSKKINNKRFIYASRNLKPGEEITTNYRMQPELEQPEDFMRKGGALLTKKVTCKKCGWKWDAEDGGNDITTCHKCGGQGLIHAQKGGESKCLNGQVWSKKDKKCIDLPVFGNSLNSRTFTKSTNLSDGFKIKPLNSFSDFGKIKPKKIPVIKDNFLETLEKDINDFLDNPKAKAAQLSESLADKDEVASDALRHSTAGALAAQTIANKTGNIPFISNPLGYLGANIAGIGHELSTLSQAYLDDRPWSVKLQESLEDIYNNSAGANTIFNNNSEKDKINYLLKLTRTNQLPDGYGEERPFRHNPKWTDPYNQKQYGGNTDAMTGMMKARLAYANEFGNPAAERMINLPDNPYQFDNGDTGSHYMASMDNYAVPQIQDENGVLQLGDYGPESNEAIRFDSDEDANYFAENYKDVSPGFLNEKQYGGISDDYIELDLTPEEIQKYKDGGYVVEELPEMQSGGSPSQVWYQYTGTPWSEARKKGLTDGSKEQNTELRKRILAGEFGEPKFSNEKYQNIKSNYDKNVEKMVAQGKTLDQLVKQKVGTRAGLKSRFPELFKTKSKLDDFLPKKNNSTSSKTQNKITTPVKNRWGNVTVKSNDGKPIYRKDDYIDMVHSKDPKIKAEGFAMQAEHKKQLELEKLIAKELKKEEGLQFLPDKYVIPGSFSNPYNPNNNIPISDNTNIYRQPMSVDWSLDPKYQDNLNLFLEKKRFEDLKAEIKADMDSKIKTGPVNYDGTVETVGQYNRRKKRYDDLDLLGKMIENDPADNYWFKPKNTSPFEDLPITGIGPTPKMILQAGKWLKPLWTGTKNATQPFRQATVSALKARAVIVVVKAPNVFAVVCEDDPDHVTEPPDATCAKLGCPPAAAFCNPVQVIFVGSVG